MRYVGDIAPGTNVDLKFTTTNTTGVPTGLASGTLSIYKDNSVTQFTTGVTLTTGFDSVVGLNHARIVTTNTTNYPVAGGNEYHAVLTAGTVSGNSVVGYVVGHFSTRNRVLGTNAILSTTINTAAITSAKFASGAITSTVIQTNAIGANEIAPGAITSAKFASAAITATVLNTGAITSAKFASDAITATVLSSTATAEVADAFLNRDMSTGTDSGSTTVRTPRQALRGIRNRTAISAGTLTVYKEDDATSSWTAAVTTAAGNPIAEVDPAGP